MPQTAGAPAINQLKGCTWKQGGGGGRVPPTGTAAPPAPATVGEEGTTSYPAPAHTMPSTPEDSHCSRGVRE